MLPFPKVTVSPSESTTTSSLRRRLPWVPCTLLTNVPYFERSTTLTHEGLAGAPERGSQATIFSTAISACTRDIDVSVWTISQSVAEMPVSIYSLIHDVQWILIVYEFQITCYYIDNLSVLGACTNGDHINFTEKKSVVLVLDGLVNTVGKIKSLTIDCISDKWRDRIQIKIVGINQHIWIPKHHLLFFQPAKGLCTRTQQLNR